MARRLSMLELQEIIIRLRKRQSIKSIRRELGRHKTIIRKLKKIGKKNNWLESDSPVPTEKQIQIAYHYSSDKGKTHPLDIYRDDINRWVGEKYSFIVIHQLLSEKVSYSESTIRRYIYKTFPKLPEPVMLRHHIPGEFMEVDFGFIGITWDWRTQRRRKTWFFSGRLRYSRKVYREIVFDQKQDTFFKCHIHSFEYFGGIPQKVMPDNLKAAVIKASFEDPLINRAYRNLAEYYGFMISPADPYSGKQKGGVESDVKYVKRNFLPLFKESQRQKGYKTLQADDLSRDLEKWNQKKSEVRIIQKVGRSPREMFKEEMSTLEKLPESRWDPVTWAEPIVGNDWRVQFKKAFYSVPWKLIGRKVQVMANSRIVRIYYDLEEITCHEKAKKPWEYKRKAEHAPPHKEEYLKQSTRGLIYIAEQSGPSVKQAAEQIFSDKAVDGIRPVRGLLRLKKKYGRFRLEEACRRAIQYHTVNYRSVKSILEKGLDKMNDEKPEGNIGQYNFRFQREHGYFNPEPEKQSTSEGVNP